MHKHWRSFRCSHYFWWKVFYPSVAILTDPTVSDDGRCDVRELFVPVCLVLDARRRIFFTVKEDSMVNFTAQFVENLSETKPERTWMPPFWNNAALSSGRANLCYIDFKLFALKHWVEGKRTLKMVFNNMVSRLWSPVGSLMFRKTFGEK